MEIFNIFWVFLLTQSCLTLNQQDNLNNNNDRGIICDGIQCPKGSKVCVVKKDSNQNTDQMTVERTCKGLDGTKFFSDVQTMSSPTRNYHFVSETTIDGNLNSNIIQSSNAGFKDSIQRELLEKTKKIEEEARNVTRQVEALQKALDGFFIRGFRLF